MDLPPMSALPHYYHQCSAEEYQAFQYYHSQAPHNLDQYYDQPFDGAPDLGYCSDSPPSSPEDDQYSYSGESFTPDGMMYCQAVQGMCGGYDEYPQPDNLDPSSPQVYLREYGSHESPYIGSSPGSCYPAFFEGDFYRGSEAGAAVPIGKLSTYSELVPHVIDDHYQQNQTPLDSPIQLSQSDDEYSHISPSQSHGSTGIDEQPQRHHPYPRSSRRQGSASPVVDQLTYTHKNKGKKRDVERFASPIQLPSAPHIPDIHSPCERTPSPCPSALESSCSPATVTPTDTTARSPTPAVEDELKLISFAMEDDTKGMKKRRRRDAVNLACYFCRKRKIACKQPPEGSEDRSCSQCRTRNLECEYPKESRRGLRRNTATSALS